MTALPPGRYAVPVHDSDAYDVDDPRFCELVGWHLVEVTKRGVTKTRTVGEEGVDMVRLSAVIDWEVEAYGHDHVTHFLTNTELRGYAQADYGRLTGRCGCCGRTLTDPASKMRGIGPECAATRQRTTH